MNPTFSLTSGTVLTSRNCQYRIEKVLGQGSFGITYLATDIVGDDDVQQYFCIKEFFMRDINGRSDTSVTAGNSEGMYDYYRRKFEQESDHLSRLRHPGIVMVTDAFRANNTSYYVMQYIDGESLDDYISRHGRLAPDEAADITSEIGSALSYMHSQGMLHLDVKPANVMMTADGRAILIDFGLSKQYDSDGHPESSTTIGAGTPGYAPIEQASHRDGNGLPVQMDVYALGATLFKMLTGQRPPEASDILNYGFPAHELQRCSVPESMAAVVSKAMSPQQAGRYSTVSGMLADMESAIHPSPQGSSASQGGDDSESTRRDSSAGSSESAESKADRYSYAVVRWLAWMLVISAGSNVIGWLYRGDGYTIPEMAASYSLFAIKPQVLLGIIGTCLVCSIVACRWFNKRWDCMITERKRIDYIKILAVCVAFNTIASVTVPVHTDDTLCASLFLIHEALCGITAYLSVIYD